MAYNDAKLNDLSYALVLKSDKKKFCDYYISLLKTNHIIIFSFFSLLKSILIQG